MIVYADRLTVKVKVLTVTGAPSTMVVSVICNSAVEEVEIAPSYRTAEVLAPVVYAFG